MIRQIVGICSFMGVLFLLVFLLWFLVVNIHWSFVFAFPLFIFVVTLVYIKTLEVFDFD